MMAVITSAEALESVPCPEGPGPICVLHGLGSSGAIHKKAQKLGLLSVGTPLFVQTIHSSNQLTLQIGHRFRFFEPRLQI